MLHFIDDLAPVIEQAIIEAKQTIENFKEKDIEVFPNGLKPVVVIQNVSEKYHVGFRFDKEAVKVGHKGLFDGESYQVVWTHEKTFTPVIFRKFSNGEIIAIFPLEPGTNDSGTCMDYLQAGQHGSCNPHHVVQNTALATPEEYESIFNELQNVIGYDDLKIIKKIPDTALQIRIEKLK